MCTCKISQDFVQIETNDFKTGLERVERGKKQTCFLRTNNVTKKILGQRTNRKIRKEGDKFVHEIERHKNIFQIKRLVRNFCGIQRSKLDKRIKNLKIEKACV